MLAKRRILSFVLLIIFFVTAFPFVTAILKVLFVSSKVWSESGTIDFLAYWSAYRAYETGGNPYDPQLLLEVQREFHQRPSPIMVWNPPWTLLMLSPLLQLNFFVASRIWMVLNLLFMFAAGVLIWMAASCQVEKDNWTGIPRAKKAVGLLFYSAVLLGFYPLWNTLHFGQLSIVLLLSLSIFLWAITRKYDFAAGVSLALLGIKPHLFLLFGVIMTWWIIREKRYRVARGFLIALAGMLALTVIFFPGTISWWLDTLFGRKLAGAIPMSDWVGTTAGGILRVIPELDTLFITIAPLVVTTCCMLVYLIRHKIELNWINHLGPILILSYFFAPWGWVYDQVILLVSYLLLMRRAISVPAKVERVFTIIFGSELLIFLAADFLMHAQHQGFWIPPFMLFIWWVVKNTLR